MKHSIKQVFFCLFAILFSGCLPHEQLTGRVITMAGPVPQAAVLAMVWIEDAGKAKPIPMAERLNGKERDIALDTDMKDRGLPAAYARTFADNNGQFKLDKLYFSAETKKTVKAMKQPRITRITLNAFQRGYLKHAVTRFPTSNPEGLPPATITLAKPQDWKELALDSSYRTLRQDEYDAGYSKDFGATKEEKNWFLTYTQSNLSEAYAQSNIKGDKNWEEDCGHDYSDVIVSTFGMQRNPAHEKCADLLHQVSVLRDWKEQWLDHAMAITETPEPAVSAVKAAVEALGPEYVEVKANEAQIVAGVTEAAEQYRKGWTNQDLSGKATTAEPQRLYNIGDKNGAYKALGYTLYAQLPGEIKKGIVTAQIPATAIPGIRDTAAGFYLQMNRPQSAQLPNGDNGDHKDKPGYKVEGATNAVGGVATDKIKPKHGRMEQAHEYNGDVIRFFDKDGVKIKELRGEVTETKTDIAKGKHFNPANFKISLSTTMAAGVDLARNNNLGRDMFVLKTGAKDIRTNANKSFVVVDESYAYSIHLTSASDSEELVGPVEDEIFSTVYDSDGNEVVRITDADGYNPRVSNTGKYLVVEKEGTKVINQKKEVLAYVPFSEMETYFSNTDKYIILVEFTHPEHNRAISVFDTQNSKLELRKFIVPNATLQGIESLDISEEKREMTIVHTHYVTEKPKVDKIAF